MIALSLVFFTGSAIATPPEPPVSTVREASSLEGELRALREELETERMERRALLQRLQRPTDSGRPDRVAHGEPIVVTPTETVRDVVAFGEDVRVEGRVRGDVMSFGGNIVIGRTGRVGGDAVSFGGVVRVEPGGRLDGDRLALDDREQRPKRKAMSWSEAFVHRITLLFSFLGAGVLAVGLFPDRVQRVSREVIDRPVRAGFVGASFTVLLSVLATLFVILTLGIGTPISAVAVGILGAAWLLGFVSVCQALGDRLPFARPHGRWIVLGIACVALAMGENLGPLGFLTMFCVSMLGIGATVSSRFGS